MWVRLGREGQRGTGVPFDLIHAANDLVESIDLLSGGRPRAKHYVPIFGLESIVLPVFRAFLFLVKRTAHGIDEGENNQRNCNQSHGLPSLRFDLQSSISSMKPFIDSTLPVALLADFDGDP